MSSRLPNEENDDDASTTASAAAAFQSALGQQVRPFLGWDPVTAMAAMQRNLLQQQQQQNNSTLNQSAATAAAMAAAAAAAGIGPPLPTGGTPAGIPPLWAAAYGLQGTAATGTNSLPPAVSSAAAASAAAASLASLSNPATGYLNHLQNHLQTPDSFLSLQQNLMLLEHIHQQRQLLAANPHLLMAAAAAQNANVNSSSSPQQNHSNINNHLQQQQHQQFQQQQQHNLNLLNSLANSHLLANQQQLQQQAQHSNASPKLDGSTNGSDQNQHNGIGTNNGNSDLSSNSGMSSLLTTVNTNISPTLTNQHQDSLVDQHFRRSLGEDYNQILANKADNKINVGK